MNNSTTNKLSALLVALFMSISSISFAQQLSTTLDSVSYSMGMLLARTVKQQGIDNVSEQAMMLGLQQYMGEGDKLLSPEVAEAVYKNYLQTARKKKQEAALLKGQAYLAENGRKKGVTTTSSGLQYEILVPGNGPKPTKSDKVNTHYHGTLIDGTVFDSSVDRGEPISFGVTQVIRGWTEALQLMPVGSKWRITIPSDLAYGTRGSGKIGPNEVLIFDLELLGIE